MLTEIIRAPASATAPARPRAALIETRLSKFRDAVQPRVRAIAAEHSWLADLAMSFPALLFTLAYPRESKSAEAARQLITSGAPLATAAQHAGVPMWLRGFPPQAFERALLKLPDSPEFRRRIANHPPSNWRVAPQWLENVARATETADEDIAIWFAREAPVKPIPVRKYHRPIPHRRRLVALWAWYSQHVDHSQAFMRTPWTSEMQWSAAKTAAFNWIDKLNLPLYIAEGGLTDTWLNDGEVDGFAFVALRTRDDVVAEAKAMKHCVASYGRDLADNRTRVWSVRRDGERVATLSLQTTGGSPYPVIRELSAAHNAPVNAEVWLAARRWLAIQDSAEVDVARFKRKSARMNAEVWRNLWRPYWIAKQRIPSWLPVAPSVSALYAL